MGSFRTTTMMEPVRQGVVVLQGTARCVCSHRGNGVRVPYVRGIEDMGSFSTRRRGAGPRGLLLELLGASAGWLVSGSLLLHRNSTSAEAATLESSAWGTDVLLRRAA